VFLAAGNLSHLTVVKGVQLSWAEDLLLFNPSQPQLAVGGAPPAEEGGFPLS